MDKELFMGIMGELAEMPQKQVWEEVVPQLIKSLPDETLNTLQFLLWTECQERFVAVGDMPDQDTPIDKYENIRGE